MRAPLAVGLAAIAIFLSAMSAQAADSGTHVGAANGIWSDAYFRAGALLADVDHFLPPGEPQTDNLAFAMALVDRAWPLSRNAWRFATGWYEHLDQDARYGESYARIVAAYPSYTDTDVRLAFDYWTIAKHPFPADYDWVLADAETLALIQGGLTATDVAGVRAAVDSLLHSTDPTNPGLSLQLAAAQTYGMFFPDRVANMQAEYDRFYGLVTAGYVAVFPRLDYMLRMMGSILRANAANPGAALPMLRYATTLEATRPTDWMTKAATALAAFVDALPAANLPIRTRIGLTEQAWGIVDLLNR